MSKGKPISPERAARLKRIAANFRLEQATGVYGLNSTPERIAAAKSRVADIIGKRPSEAEFPFPPDDGQDPPVQ